LHLGRSHCRSVVFPLGDDVFVHEIVVDFSFSYGLLKLLPIASAMQVADIFTKPLASAQFPTLKSKLGLTNIYSPA